MNYLLMLSFLTIINKKNKFIILLNLKNEIIS